MPVPALPALSTAIQKSTAAPHFVLATFRAIGHGQREFSNDPPQPARRALGFGGMGPEEWSCLGQTRAPKWGDTFCFPMSSRMVDMAVKVYDVGARGLAV